IAELPARRPWGFSTESPSFCLIAGLDRVRSVSSRGADLWAAANRNKTTFFFFGVAANQKRLPPAIRWCVAKRRTHQQWILAAHGMKPRGGRMRRACRCPGNGGGGE